MMSCMFDACCNCWFYCGHHVYVYLPTCLRSSSKAQHETNYTVLLIGFVLRHFPENNIRKHNIQSNKNLHPTTQDIAVLVLSAADVEAILAESGSWSNVTKEIARACSGSKTGQGLFGFAHINIVCESVGNLIDKQLKSLTDKYLDHAVMKTWEDETAKLLADVGDLRMLPAKRLVQLSYRGCCFELPLSSARQEMDIKLQILVKHCAVAAGMLPSLTFEEELCDKKAVPALKGVAEDLVEASRKARETANALLEQAQANGSEGIKSVLDQKEVHLLTMQREFSVEIGFLRAMMGDGGKTRLEAAVLESLPGPDNPGAWSPKTSLQAVTAIQGSPLYAFVAPSVQQAVVSCRELLHSITNGLAPRVDSSRASAFVKLVLKKCELFVFENAPDKDKEEAPEKMLYGADALKLKFQKLTEKCDNEEEVSLGDLDCFKSFEWMLDASSVKKLKEITVQVCAKAGMLVPMLASNAAPACAPSDSSGSKATIASKKRKLEVHHAASELFS